MQTPSGTAVSGASIDVYNAGGTVHATIYSDDGITSTPNPLTSASDGTFGFYVADGRYDLKVSGTGITTRTFGDVEIFDATEKNAGDGTLTASAANFTTLTVTGVLTASGANILNASTLTVGGVAPTNQALIGNGTTFTPTALSLASAQFANQGTTTKVLHGNAAGNPSFGAVVQGDVTNGYVDLSTLQSIGGVKTFTSDTIHKSLNGLAVVFADQYTDIQTAMNALPAGGGVVDARSPNTNLVMGAIDTGSNTKIVTLLLGPYTYTFTQVTVRQGFNIIGAGYLDTVLSNVGTNANPAFVIPQVNNNAITLHWRDFQVLGLAGNTSQDGIFFDASTLTNAGVELSTFENIQLTGFAGATIHLKATQNGASGSIGAIQGNTFINITAIRPTGATGATQNALRIEGGCGQIDFINCWFTGNASDTGTNVFVGTNSTQAPYSIHFHSCTNQNGFAYLFDGGTSITTENDHFEVIKGCYNLANTGQLLVGVNIKTPHINSNVGVNAGNGYIINIPNTVTNAEVTLDTPLVYATPDNLVKNLAGNLASVKVINARTFNSASPANVYVSSGVTGTLTPAATVDLKGWNSVQVSNSATSMTMFKSTLMPGETVTLYASGGTIQFATGGNLSLGANSSPLIVPSGDSVMFMRVDAGTPAFVLIAYSRGTNLLINTVATEAGSGNSITLLNSQDTLGNVTGNGTDLTLYTFTIPANTIQAGKGFRIRMHVISNNAVTCAYKLTVGSTTVSLGSSTGNSNVDFQVEVFNNAGVQNAQRGMGFGFEGTVAIIFNTTFTMAENFANALAVKITANEANPNTVTPNKWFIELIQ